MARTGDEGKGEEENRAARVMEGWRGGIMAGGR